MPGTKNPNNPSRFKKGQSGNPAGSNKRYRELKGLTRLTHREVVELGTAILNGSLTDLEAIKSDPDASVHKIWLASLVINAMIKQDYKAYHMLMDRIVGKPREHARIDIAGAEDGAPVRVEAVPPSLPAINAELATIAKEYKLLGDD